jgi:hypothetical protein
MSAPHTPQPQTARAAVIRRGQGVRVHVLEQRLGEPVPVARLSYVSPSHPDEQQGRLLARLLLGRPALTGDGPWRQAVAGGHLIVWLEPTP